MLLTEGDTFNIGLKLREYILLFIFNYYLYLLFIYMKNVYLNKYDVIHYICIIIDSIFVHIIYYIYYIYIYIYNM